MTRLTATALVALALAPASALAAGSSDIAALQVALRQHRLYRGPVDGLSGPATDRALTAFQRRAGLVPDGIVGPETRQALGPFGGPDLGERPLALGDRGWDVAELQFLLAWHGFPSGAFDGVLGARTHAALLRFQRWRGLPPVGAAGPATMAALCGPPPRSPLALSWPLEAPLGDGFGPRGAGFHAGLDLEAPAGTPVGAAASGRVTWAGPSWGGWGNLVVVAHGGGVRTLYAHLARIDVAVGDRVAAGSRLGLVGATGRATGPHLHLEVRLRGAAVDPLTALPEGLGAAAQVPRSSSARRR